MLVPTRSRFSRFDAFRGIPRLTHATFITRALGSYVPPLTWVTGFHQEAIHFCAMHIVNLGIDQWVNAATLLALLEREFFGAKTVALSERLQVCTLRFRRWCSLHGIMQSQPFITVGMLHLGSKAAPTPPEFDLESISFSGLPGFFLSCCCEVALQKAGDDSELQLIAALTSNLAHWHLAVETYPRYLVQQQAAHLSQLADRVCLLYKRAGSSGHPELLTVLAFEAQASWISRDQFLHAQEHVQFVGLLTASRMRIAWVYASTLPVVSIVTCLSSDYCAGFSFGTDLENLTVAEAASASVQIWRI